MERMAFHQQVLQHLLPGFRFHPTDEELLIHYLKKKVSSSPLPAPVIAEIELYNHDPWDLPAKACFGEQEWYFFSPRDRKYPNGARPNRSAGSGYWKATGTDKPVAIMLGTTSSQKVGVKKSLVFYKGRPPKGLKTNWIMHEYCLAETIPPKRKRSLRYLWRQKGFMVSQVLGLQASLIPMRNSSLDFNAIRLDDWVLCRIYKKLSHYPMVVSRPEMEEPSAADVQHTQQKSAIAKFGSFSGLLQSEGPFMESFLSHAMSDANAALSDKLDPLSILQVVPQQLNSFETKSHVSMTLGLTGDEVCPAKRQKTLNPSSSLQLQSLNQNMAMAVPDQHMYQLPFNENWTPESLAWPLPTEILWSSYDNG